MTRFGWLHRIVTGHWPHFVYGLGHSWRKRCVQCGREYL